jgi:NodT family efflux transporter outer membrane factor (OMF) lipoprotein
MRQDFTERHRKPFDESKSGRSERPFALAVLPCILALVFLSGCCHLPGGRCRDWWRNGFKVGPNYCPPAAPVASEWIDYADPRVKSEEQQLCHWWSVFNDPTLDSLIQTAYDQNLTLRAAGARIIEARALRGIAVGNLFPQEQFAFGEYSRIKLSTNVANPPLSAWFSEWTFGLSGTWELDFWGRYRRAIEAADAELDASVEDYDDVLVVLLSDVAATYVEYRTFQQRLTYARANVAIQRLSFQLATDKFEAGATTERDTFQAKQILEETEALIPALEIGRRQAANRLCVLLGMPPRDLDAILGAGSGIPVAPTEVVVGVPADLVRRRPDVRRAERLVAAQSARIGVAMSDLYPHFSVLGTIGVEAEQFGDLFKSGSMIGEISPGFRWDILNYGRLVNNVRVQDARFQELAYAYQDQVLIAGQEAEDAIVAFLKSQEQAQHLGASVTAAARTVEITNEQYNQGAIDFTAVFVFQENLTDQQDEFAIAQGNIAQSLIAVYRALGGGWQIRLGGGAPLSEPTMTLPDLEEIPPPGDQGHDIQFPSLIGQSPLLSPADSEEILPSAALTAGPGQVNLDRISE